MPTLPSHTEAVECAVNDVIQVSAKVFGLELRHTTLVLAEKSRKKRNKLEAKYSFA
jgi:hypothetical protein